MKFQTKHSGNKSWGGTLFRVSATPMTFFMFSPESDSVEASEELIEKIKAIKEMTNVLHRDR